MLCHYQIYCVRHVPWNQWCHALQLETIWEDDVAISYCSVQLNFFHRWQQGEVAARLAIPHSSVILQQLFKIFDYPQRGDAIMAENQFQGHQENQKASTVPTRPRACAGEEKGFFSHHRFGFPFAKGNQPAAPESLPLVRARSWSCSELLVMQSQVASN